MPPSLVTYGEKLSAARAGGASRPDEPSAIVAATNAVATRQPAVSQRSILVSMVGVSSDLGMRAWPGPDRPGHAVPTSLRTRGRRAQDGVVLAEDVILRGARLMTRVAG